MTNYEQEIKNALSNQEVLKIEQITTGLSDSKIYKVILKNKKIFIARFLDPKRDLKEREWEISLMQETAKKSISPAIIYSSPNQDLIIMDYIDGKNFNQTFLGDPLLKKLASNLKILHSLPIENAIKITTLEKRFLVKSSTKEYQHFLSMFRALEKDFLTNSTLAITHTNLHPGNMLADKENVWVIDWQDAGLYGPLFDVARLAIELRLALSNEQEKNFLKDFFKDYSEIEMTQKVQALATIKIIDSLVNAYTKKFLKDYFEREMTQEETVNYKKAQALATMKIIDSLVHAYTKDSSEEDKNSTIIQLFTKAKAGAEFTNPMDNQESLILYLLNLVYFLVN